MVDQFDPKTKERSEKMIMLLNAVKGESIQDFPVPPFTKWLNGRVIEAKRGDIEFEFDVRPEMANPTGLLHGGMQCAMIDDCFGVACATLGYEGFLLSIDINVDYMGKVKVGEKVRVRANIAREGKSIVHAHATIKDIAGNIIADANSNLLVTQFKPKYVEELDKQ